MPTYQYQCGSCHHELEEFQSITADPLTLCPKCEKETLRRKIGGGGSTLQFKGSGFYITDYAKKGDSSCPCGSETSCSSKES